MRDGGGREKPWFSVTGPGDIEDDRESERLSLDVRASDYDFLTSFAAYRNALARVMGKRIRKQWSRKQMAESFISMQVDAMRAQLAEMLKACGELPTFDSKDPKSRAAMDSYVKKVIAWDAKRSKADPSDE